MLASSPHKEHNQPLLLSSDEDPTDWTLDHEKILFSSENELGRGAYGVVFKGQYLKTDVAIKCFTFQLSGDDLELIRNEFSVLKSLRHPNIVLFMGLAIRPSGEALLVQEFVPGGSLQSLVR